MLSFESRRSLGSHGVASKPLHCMLRLFRAEVTWFTNTAAHGIATQMSIRLDRYRFVMAIVVREANFKVVKRLHCVCLCQDAWSRGAAVDFDVSRITSRIPNARFSNCCGGNQNGRCAGFVGGGNMSTPPQATLGSFLGYLVVQFARDRTGTLLTES